MEKIFNIIIAGTGGQGVFMLSNVLRALCAKYNFQCHGATFKGGAQRLGSIHTELRVVFNAGADKSIFSSQISKGSLDLLIGLEPWEALRFANHCHKRTKVICNTHKQTLYIERYQPERMMDPLCELKRIFPDLILNDFTVISIRKYGHTKMLNYLLLKQLIDNKVLPFDWKDAEDAFSILITKKTK